jgi:hypothetical protein
MQPIRAIDKHSNQGLLVDEALRSRTNGVPTAAGAAYGWRFHGDVVQGCEGAFRFSLNGARLVATATGALFWPDEATLIVSDLHLEKGSHFAARGVLLPPYDSRTTLRRLGASIRELAAKRVISLGDAFHDHGAEARMDDADAEILDALTRAADWVWVLGNHDPAPPARFRGVVEQDITLGPLRLRHEPCGRSSPGEVAGHLHPAARVRLETRIIRRRCFVTDGERLILPAFGAYAGGLNVLDAAFAPLFDTLTCLVLGGQGVYAFSEAALEPDPAPAHRLTA